MDGGTMSQVFVYPPSIHLKELGQKIGERNTIINGVVLLLGLYLSFVDQMYETRENLSDYSQNESPDELGFFANPVGPLPTHGAAHWLVVHQVSGQGLHDSMLLASRLAS